MSKEFTLNPHNQKEMVDALNRGEETLELNGKLYRIYYTGGGANVTYFVKGEITETGGSFDVAGIDARIAKFDKEVERKIKAKTTSVEIRFSQGEKAELIKIAAEQNKTLSNFIREAVSEKIARITHE